MAIERPISAEEATVSTVSVDVKVLRIGNKQMTLAVYKQLLSESIFDLSGNGLLGTPWGYVNYHLPDSCPASDHFHLIWEKSGELRRCVITNQWYQRDVMTGDDKWYCRDEFKQSFYDGMMDLGQLFIAV